MLDDLYVYVLKQWSKLDQNPLTSFVEKFGFVSEPSENILFCFQLMWSATAWLSTAKIISRYTFKVISVFSSGSDNKDLTLL